MKNIFGIFGGLTVSKPAHNLTIENIQAIKEVFNSSVGSIVTYYGKYPPAYVWPIPWYYEPEYEELRKKKLFRMLME